MRERARLPLRFREVLPTPGQGSEGVHLPEGVAQKFRPGDVLMLQTHYVNASIQATPAGGEVRINFYKSKVENPIEMGTLFATCAEALTPAPRSTAGMLG